jgi:hypothetical protein
VFPPAAFAVSGEGPRYRASRYRASRYRASQGATLRRREEWIEGVLMDALEEMALKA